MDIASIVKRKSYGLCEWDTRGCPSYEVRRGRSPSNFKALMEWDVPGMVIVHGLDQVLYFSKQRFMSKGLLKLVRYQWYGLLEDWENSKLFTSEYRFLDKVLCESNLRHEFLLHQIIRADTMRSCDLRCLLCLLLGLDPNIVEYYMYGMSRGTKVFSVNIQGSDSHMINWEISMRKAELVLHKDCTGKAGIVYVKTTWVSSSLIR